MIDIGVNVVGERQVDKRCEDLEDIREVSGFDPIIITWHGNEIASTCARIVVSSSNVSLMSEMTRRRCVFMLFTVDSHKPPKFGARSWMNFQEIP